MHVMWCLPPLIALGRMRKAESLIFVISNKFLYFSQRPWAEAIGLPGDKVICGFVYSLWAISFSRRLTPNQKYKSIELLSLYLVPDKFEIL